MPNIEANGVDFHYLDAGEPGKPLVLCMHGFPDTPHGWLPLLQRLGEEGEYYVVAPFSRGYAPTGQPADGDYHAKQLALDTLALIEALGYERADLVGHDWGASAVYGAALMRPERVRKLVAMAIPPPRALKPSPGLLASLWHFAYFQTPFLPERHMRRNDHAFLDTIWNMWTHDGWRQGAPPEVKEHFAMGKTVEAAIGYYRAFKRIDRDYQKTILGKLQVPTLGLAGEDDFAAVNKCWGHAERVIKAPFELHWIPRAAHFLHYENPNPVFDHIVRFLQEP